MTKILTAILLSLLVTGPQVQAAPKNVYDRIGDCEQVESLDKTYTDKKYGVKIPYPKHWTSPKLLDAGGRITYLV